MKILMLTPYLPYPPASGGQIRTFNLLKYLSKNHNITLISLYKNEKEKEYESHLQNYCQRIYLCKRPEKPWQPGIIFQSIFSFLPFLIVRNFSHEAKHTIESLLKMEHFDIIHAETFYIMPHIPKTTIPVLLVEQTIEYKVYQHYLSSMPVWVRTLLYIDIIKLKYWELFYWKKAETVSTVSEHDRTIIQTLTPTITPVVIPNGAGDEMYVEKLGKKDLVKPVLLFVGNFYWLQNVEAADYFINKLFPKLQKAVPNIQIVIAGQNAKQKIKNDAIDQIKIVNIAQDDTETVKKLYSEATLFIAPIFGPGGTRLKILAAMASGLPVITTKIGIEGLATENEKHVLLAQNPENFVEQTQKILGDKKLYESIRENARKLVKEKFSWKSIAQQLEVVYKTIITSNAHRN